MELHQPDTATEHPVTQMRHAVPVPWLLEPHSQQQLAAAKSQLHSSANPSTSTHPTHTTQAGSHTTHHCNCSSLSPLSTKPTHALVSLLTVVARGSIAYACLTWLPRNAPSHIGGNQQPKRCEVKSPLWQMPQAKPGHFVRYGNMPLAKGVANATGVSRRHKPQSVCLAYASTGTQWLTHRMSCRVGCLAAYA